MKNLLTILLLLLLCFESKAQTGDTLICDYPDRDSIEFENLPWVGNNQYLENFLDSIGYPNAQARIVGSDRVRFHVPIKFWVYRNSAGIGGPSMTDLRNYIDNLNRAFNVDNQTLIGFYMKCDVGYINDDAHVVVATDLEAMGMIADHKDPGCINIHLVSNLETATGATYRARFFGVDGIMLSSETYTTNVLGSTIAHEVGHYFELDHTHQYYNKGNCRQEPIDRNRTWPFLNVCFHKSVGSRMCEATGDGLSDTPADPELGNNYDCAFNNAGAYTNRIDNWGDHYVSPPSGSSIPDTRNLMNYNFDRTCRTVFSRLQIAVMLHSIYRGKSNGSRSAWMNSLGEYDEYEMDNYSEVARPIAFNEIQERNFNSEYRGLGVWGQCDVDWVKFVPSCSGNLMIETSEIALKTFANTRLTLFDASLNQLAQNDNNPAFPPFSLITYNFTAGQTYYIRIDNMGSTGTSYYKLQIHVAGISGADFICPSASYLIPNLPAGSSVNWTVTPSGVVTPTSSSSNPVTLTRISNGNITLSASIAACGTNYTLIKSIPVGAPTTTCSEVGGGACFRQVFLCPSQLNNWQYVNIPGTSGLGGTGFHIEAQGGAYFNGGATSTNITTNSFSVWAPSLGAYNSTSVTVSAMNGCGVSPNTPYVIAFIEKDPYQCGGYYYYSIAPNPAQSDATISLNSKNTDAAHSNFDQVRIYDQQGNLKFTRKFGKVKSSSVNISTLANGFYIIEISNGTYKERQQLLVQK